METLLSEKAGKKNEQTNERKKNPSEYKLKEKIFNLQYAYVYVH